MVHSIALQILPSPKTNDHQVRLYVDGQDWLNETSLGLDPTDFFRQSALRTTGSLIIGRCDCGVIGCGDITVDAKRNSTKVTWCKTIGHEIDFDLHAFDLEIQRADQDLSWETVNRTAERLANDLLHGLEIDGFRFQWASTRIKPATLSMSFALQEQQRLIDISWDGISWGNALENVQRFRETLTNNQMSQTVVQSIPKS